MTLYKPNKQSSLYDRIKGMLISFAPDELTIAEMESLRELLDLAIAREKGDLELFALSRTDPRENLRLQFDKLHELLAGAGIGVSDNAAKNEDGVIKWTLTRRLNRSEAAILRLSQAGVWSVEPRGINPQKPGDLAAMSLTRLLLTNNIDLASLGGWKLVI